MYQPVGQGQGVAPFPSGSRIDVLELLFMRSWQAHTIVPFLYYTLMLLGFIQWIW
jgi:hypothetical protein